jgi:hypothetical protein
VERRTRRRGPRRPQRRALTGTVPGWAARALDDLPPAADAEPGAPWYPLQHAFGFTAFGANVFVAGRRGHVLVEPHDESGSGQEELYLVIRGGAEFTLDDATVAGAALFVVAVRDPGVRRSAVALEADTTLLVLGGRPSDAFESTWRPSHFEGVPRVL